MEPGTRTESVIEKLRAIQLRKQREKVRTIPSNDPLYNSIEAPALFKGHKVVEIAAELYQNLKQFQDKNMSENRPAKMHYTNEKVARMVKEIQDVLSGAFPASDNVEDYIEESIEIPETYEKKYVASSLEYVPIPPETSKSTIKGKTELRMEKLKEVTAEYEAKRKLLTKKVENMRIDRKIFEKYLGKESVVRRKKPEIPKLVIKHKKPPEKQQAPKDVPASENPSRQDLVQRAKEVEKKLELQKMNLSIANNYSISPLPNNGLPKRCHRNPYFGLHYSKTHSQGSDAASGDNKSKSVFRFEPSPQMNSHKEIQNETNTATILPSIKVEYKERPAEHLPKLVNLSDLCEDRGVRDAHSENFMPQPPIRLAKKLSPPNRKSPRGLHLPVLEENEGNSMLKKPSKVYNPTVNPKERPAYLKARIGKHSRKLTQSFAVPFQTPRGESESASLEDAQKKWELLQQKIHKISSIIASTARNVVQENPEPKMIGYRTNKRTKLYNSSIIFDLSRAKNNNNNSFNQ